LVAFLKIPVFLENVAGDPYTLGAREIWVIGPHGESPRRLIAADELSGFERIAWSPTGDRIAYKYWNQQGDALHVSLESIRLSGTDKTAILSDDRLEDFAWVLSDRLIYSQKAESYTSDYSADHLWDLRLDPRRRTGQGSRTFQGSQFPA
jgi:hypothetical protein